MTWTDQDVRLRLLEAADTIFHQQVSGTRPAGTGNAWLMAIDGWDAMGAAPVKVQYRPDAAAISRSEEAQAWLPLIADDATRAMVWARAACEAGRRSFADWCSKNAIVRRTAYRRTDKQYAELALTLCNRGVPLRLADDLRMSQLGAIDDTESPTLAHVASPRFERASDARPEPGLPDDPRAFEAWLKKTNASRRKEQERRRREKLKRIEEGLAA